MVRDKVGAFTVRTAADMLSIALNYALRMKLIPTNTANAVDKPKVPKRDMLCLDDSQAKRLLTTARDAAVGPVVAVALATGCRQGELLALAWEDIDLRAGTLKVCKSLSQTKAGFVVKPPKTDASRRSIILPAFAVDVLTALKTDALKKGLLAAPVFCTRTGNYLAKKNVLRAFKALVKRSNKGVGDDTAKPIPEKVRFHDLRHTAASLLLSKGYSLRAVASRLGHANPTMTLRVYGHVMPGDDARLAEG
jgi:integrase